MKDLDDLIAIHEACAVLGRSRWAQGARRRRGADDGPQRRLSARCGRRADGPRAPSRRRSVPWPLAGRRATCVRRRARRTCATTNRTAAARVGSSASRGTPPARWLARPDQGRRAPAQPRCLIPRFDGAILSIEWKEALWDKFVTEAPRPRTPSEQQYSDRKLRSRS